MNALVTGGAGFIGSNVVKKLLASGIEPIVVDNLSSGHRVNLDGLDVEFIQGDVCDLDALLNIQKPIDVIFHLAASVGRQKSIENPVLDSMVNIIGSLNIIELARQKKIPRIVYSSSAAIYGELLTELIREDHPLNPDSPYGVSKLAAEKHFLAAAEIYGIKVVCLRYFNVFGNNQRFDAYGNVIPIFANRLMNGLPLIIYGDGGQTRDFIHVSQVAKANHLAGTADVAGGAYNLGCGIQMTINELATRMQDISAVDCGRSYQPERKGDVRHCRADIGRFVKVFGFAPEYDMAKYLSDYWAWFSRAASL